MFKKFTKCAYNLNLPSRPERWYYSSAFRKHWAFINPPYQLMPKWFKVENHTCISAWKHWGGSICSKLTCWYSKRRRKPPNIWNLLFRTIFSIYFNFKYLLAIFLWFSLQRKQNSFPVIRENLTVHFNFYLMQFCILSTNSNVYSLRIPVLQEFFIESLKCYN